MIAAIEIMRMVATVLKDGAVGVNAQIAALTLDGVDARPGIIKAVLNEADDDCQIEEKPAIGFPVILVLEGDEGLTAAPEAVTGYRDGNAVLDIVYIRESAKRAQLWRDSKYVNQAVINSLDLGLLHPTTIGTAGLRNRIQILQATRLAAGIIQRDPTTGDIAVGVKVGFDFRHNIV